MSIKLGIILADFRTSLATKILVAGTTLTLVSATDDDSVALPAGKYYFTIDGDNSQKEHIYCTLSGTSLSSIYSVSRQGVHTSGAAREHRVGATIVITDFAHILELNKLLSGETTLNGSSPLSYDTDPTISNDKHLATKKYVDDSSVATTGNETIAGIKTFSELLLLPNSSPTSALQGASKGYVDGVSIAGAANADLTTKGIVEEATAAEIVAGTQAGATGAELVVNPKYLYDAEFKKERKYISIAQNVWHAPTANLTWEDWDISVYIPANALYADILVNANGANNDIGVRPNGSAVSRMVFIGNGTTYLGTFNLLTELDENRIVEIYGLNSSSYALFTVVGYWI